MSRTNIFELFKQNNDMGKDVDRIHDLYLNYYFVEGKNNPPRFTLKEFVEKYCFDNWKNRGRCLNIDDFLETIEYSSLLYRARMCSTEAFLSVIETIYNFWHLAVNYIDKNPELFERYGIVDTLQESMDECLSEFNQKAFYFPAEEKCIIAEDSPQVTAAAEASEPEIALEIVRYNHRQLAGDVTKKKAILKTMGDVLEGRKKEITSINNTLYNTITGCLNNLNIRHNNIAPENKGHYHKAVAEMLQGELEQHYDDLYQLMLLAILEMDNVARKRDMQTLVQRVAEKKE